MKIVKGEQHPLGAARLTISKYVIGRYRPNLGKEYPIRK